MAGQQADSFLGDKGNWKQIQIVEAKRWTCGYCGNLVSSDRGFVGSPHEDGSGTELAGIRICPHCKGPTFFAPDHRQYPGELIGLAVPNTPPELGKLYTEARASATAGAFTAAVLTCRKMLMNIAVNEGAAGNKNFITYVEYLSEKGYIPPNGKGWVDYIRTRGNEATHEIALMTATDARALITFVGMLLRFIYEFPTLVADFQLLATSEGNPPEPVLGIPATPLPPR